MEDDSLAPNGLWKGSRQLGKPAGCSSSAGPQERRRSPISPLSEQVHVCNSNNTLDRGDAGATGGCVVVKLVIFAMCCHVLVGVCSTNPCLGMPVGALSHPGACQARLMPDPSADLSFSATANEIMSVAARQPASHAAQKSWPSRFPSPETLALAPSQSMSRALPQAVRRPQKCRGCRHRIGKFSARVVRRHEWHGRLRAGEHSIHVPNNECCSTLGEPCRRR